MREPGTQSSSNEEEDSKKGDDAQFLQESGIRSNLEFLDTAYLKKKKTCNCEILLYLLSINDFLSFQELRIPQILL